MAHAETGTADFTSTITAMSAFTLTGGADAAVVNIREATVAGTIKYVFKAALGSTQHFIFDPPVQPNNASGVPQVWFVDLSSGTTPQMTITGD